MQERHVKARVRAAIEEELGSFRQFADLPATEIERMAARILRAIDNFVSDGGEAARESRAA